VLANRNGSAYYNTDVSIAWLASCLAQTELDQVSLEEYTSGDGIHTNHNASIQVQFVRFDWVESIWSETGSNILLDISGVLRVCNFVFYEPHQKVSLMYDIRVVMALKFIVAQSLCGSVCTSSYQLIILADFFFYYYYSNGFSLEQSFSVHISIHKIRISHGIDCENYHLLGWAAV
jgi:hypothetical protein